MNARVVE